MSSPRNSILGSFALMLGAFVCAAVGGAVALVFGSGDSGPVPEQSAADTPAELERFAERLDLLEDRLSLAPAKAQPVAHRREEAADPVATLALAERIGRLERAVAELRSAGSVVPEGRAAELARAPRAAQDPAERLREIEGHQQRILDPRATEQQKLEAWGDLRRHEDGWNDAVVAQMVHLGLTSTDPIVRADVWRQADARAQHDALVPALLQALQNDADDQAREEAAETLVEYADRQGVRTTVQQLLASEQSEGVRRYLARAQENAK